MDIHLSLRLEKCVGVVSSKVFTFLTAATTFGAIGIRLISVSASLLMKKMCLIYKYDFMKMLLFLHANKNVSKKLRCKLDPCGMKVHLYVQLKLFPILRDVAQNCFVVSIR